MRALAYIAFPLLLACALYVGAVSPAIDAVRAMGASIATPAQHSGPCFSDSAAKHFGVSPRANAQNCALQQISQ